MTATIHQAKTHLSKLIRKVLDGEEVIIANRNKPLVRLQPVGLTRTSGKIGGLKAWAASWEESPGKKHAALEREFDQQDQADPLASK